MPCTNSRLPAASRATTGDVRSGSRYKTAPAPRTIATRTTGAVPSPRIPGTVTVCGGSTLRGTGSCPTSGVIVHGTKDSVVPEADVQKLVDRLTAQKGIKITYTKVEGANHFFDNHTDDVLEIVEEYARNRMANPEGR